MKKPIRSRLTIGAEVIRQLEAGRLVHALGARGMTRDEGEFCNNSHDLDVCNKSRMEPC